MVVCLHPCRERGAKVLEERMTAGSKPQDSGVEVAADVESGIAAAEETPNNGAKQ